VIVTVLKAVEKVQLAVIEIETKRKRNRQQFNIENLATSSYCRDPTMRRYLFLPRPISPVRSTQLATQLYRVSDVSVETTSREVDSERGLIGVC